VTEELPLEPAGGRVPHVDCPVEAGRRETPAVDAERDVLDGPEVPDEAQHLPSATRVPAPHIPVFAGRGEAGAVGAEDHGLNYILEFEDCFVENLSSARDVEDT
jgi:hypothetical protein